MPGDRSIDRDRLFAITQVENAVRDVESYFAVLTWDLQDRWDEFKPFSLTEMPFRERRAEIAEDWTILNTFLRGNPYVPSCHLPLSEVDVVSCRWALVALRGGKWVDPFRNAKGEQIHGALWILESVLGAFLTSFFRKGRKVSGRDDLKYLVAATEEVGKVVTRLADVAFLQYSFWKTEEIYGHLESARIPEPIEVKFNELTKNAKRLLVALVTLEKDDLGPFARDQIRDRVLYLYDREPAVNTAKKGLNELEEVHLIEHPGRYGYRLTAAAKANLPEAFKTECEKEIRAVRGRERSYKKHTK